MSTDNFKKPKFNPGTYMVDKFESEKEMRRVEVQDRVVTNLMGGVLPEQPNPSEFQSILDFGCGTGGWLIRTAQEYPGMSRLVGVDINPYMVDYARKQAKEQQVSDRIKFETLDVIVNLYYKDGSFDLSNVRFGTSYLRTWDWPKMIYEMRRVVRPGGVVRVTEGSLIPRGGPGLDRFYQLMARALHNAGHIQTEDPGGITDHLYEVMERHGVREIQSKKFEFIGQPGTPEGDALTEDWKYGFRTIRPFLEKFGGRFTFNYDELSKQVAEDMQKPEFHIEGRLVTFWGIRPLNS